MSETRNAGQFQVGENWRGNADGRPKGSRNELQENFLKDVLAAWKANGKQAIDDMIADKPGDFVKMVASLLPKDVNLNVNDDRELTDDELVERIRVLTAAVAPLIGGGAGESQGAAGTPALAKKPSGVH